MNMISKSTEKKISDEKLIDTESTTPPLTSTLRVRNRRTLVKLLFLVAGFFGLAYAMIPLYDVMCQALGIGEGRTPILSISSSEVPQNKMAAMNSSMTPAMGHKNSDAMSSSKTVPQNKMDAMNSSMTSAMDHESPDGMSSSETSQNAVANMTQEQLQAALNRDIRVVFSKVVTDELPWEVVPVQSEITVKPGKSYTIMYRAKNISNRAISGQAIPSYSPAQAGTFLQKIECFCFNLQTLKPKEVKDMAVTFTVLPNLPEDIAIITLHYRFIKVSG